MREVITSHLTRSLPSPKMVVAFPVPEFMDSTRYLVPGSERVKMNRSVYVVGGKDAKNQLLASCERFDGHSWIISQYSLPYAVFMASVFVSKHETFAVLIGGRKYRSHGYIGHSIMHKYDDTYQHNEKIMIFTEKTGWKVIRTPASVYFTVPNCHPSNY